MSSKPRINDLAAVVRLAGQAYSAVHDGPEEYRYMLDEVSMMRLILLQIESFEGQAEISAEKMSEWNTAIAGCNADLAELQQTILKYEKAHKTDIESDRKLDKIKGLLRRANNRAKLGIIATEDTSALRSRMALHSVALAKMSGIDVSSKSGACLEFGEREILILVLGPATSGKSEFIRLVSGRNEGRIADILKSETGSLQTWRFKHGGLNYTLLEGPSFDDTQKNDLKTVAKLAEYLEMAFRARFLVSGIIYMHRISDSQSAGPFARNLEFLPRLCGADALKNVAFVTTFWGEAKDDPRRAAARERELAENWWKGAMDLGAVMRRLGAGRQSALGILGELAGRTRVVLDIQRELVEKEMSLEESCIGQLLSGTSQGLSDGQNT